MDHPDTLNVVEFLDAVAARGEQLHLVDGQLHYRAPQGPLQQRTAATIRTHRETLIQWLHEQQQPPTHYPLSAGQQGLWMAWRLDPSTTIYNLYWVFQLQDGVQLDALQEAFQRLIQRHPVLRSRFPIPVDGPPQQWVEAATPLTVALYQQPSWTDTQITDWIHQQADQPFNLAAEWPMRLAVLQIGSRRFLHWTLHHIAADFLTHEILLSDLERLYCGQAVTPASALSYREFVRWEQDLLTTETPRLAAFWQPRIDQWPPPPSLPTARDLNHTTPSSVATVTMHFAPTLTAALRTLGRSKQLSLFTILLTAYEIVLARYTEQARFIVTTPTSVRHLSGWERSAGYFINPLCLLADLSGEPSVEQLLDRVAQDLHDCFAHQQFPFTETLRRLKATGRNDTPAFGFILDAARQTAQAPSLFANTLASGQRGALEALSLSIFDLDGTLSGELIYDPQRFHHYSMVQLLEYFQTALNSMLEDLTQPVHRLQLLSPAQRKMLLDEWTATQVTHPSAQRQVLTTQFSHQVAQTPSAIALIEADTGTSISYQALDGWANAIAHRLVAEGVNPGQRVAVLLPRSIQTVAALLGILKAGAAYVPLDPAYPTPRLEYILRDAGVCCYLSESSLAQRLDATIARALCWERLPPQADAPALDLSPTDLAYVIYTSGSTGQPKGVEAEYGATANRLAWMWRTLPFTADEVCCQKTALSFVDSVWEIFGPLLQGVPSVIIPAAYTKDVPCLVQQLQQHRVTRIVLVPSLLRAMLDYGIAELAQLTLWICSGEVLPVELVRRFRQALPSAKLINLYGSSEVAADVSYFDTATLDDALASVPIGQPIDNCQCYILDAHREPTPPGIAGELYVGGVCLARGYHGQPELSAERFIANPFGNGRLFRTGDRARWQSTPVGRPDIDYLGRRDTQIKIRGFRVELSEIEAQLRAYAAHEDAVVALHEERLVAYIAIGAQPPPNEAALYQQLLQQLPDYMVPSAFVWLEQLPLTPNGKVDRQSLTELAVPRGPLGGSAYTPPASPLEHTLADIWAGVLQQPQVGRDDNFFALGGHSLLATQVMTQLDTALGQMFPVSLLFDHPTVASLARQLEQHREAPIAPLQQPSSETLRPTAQPRPAQLALSFAQERHWFLAQLEQSGVYNIALPLRLYGPLDVTRLTAALQRLMQRHESLRSCFPASEGVPRQQIMARLDVPIETLDLSHWPRSERPQQAQQVLSRLAAAPFDLAQGPLLRAVIAPIDANDTVLMLALHHIIADGWSLGVLMSELDAAYRDVPLAALALQYADYALWQRQLMRSEHCQQQLRWWQQQLTGIPTLLNLPSDHPRPAVQSTAAGTVRWSLTADVVTQLEQLAESQGASLFMAVFALLASLLARYSGAEALIIGSPVANRHHPGLEPLIGCFVNTLALPADVSADPSFCELLQRVRRTVLDAYAHQDIPFEHLVEALQVERSLSYAPLFQVLLSVEYGRSHPAARDYTLGEAQGHWLDLGCDTTPFDLAIELVRTDAGLQGWIDYSSDLFEATTITRLAGHLQVLTAQAVAQPHRPVSALAILTLAERQQLLTQWNPPAPHARANDCLHTLVERQVARTPDAPAVVVATPGLAPEACETLSYAQLNARADALAQHLMALAPPAAAIDGIDRNTVDSAHLGPLVGIYLSRSAGLVVAALGILKAGYGLVPLEPTWPNPRLSAILDAAQPFAVVTEAGLMDAAPLGSMLKVDLYSVDTTPSVTTPTHTAPSSDPRDVAYIMFTSGSTGTPKGVITEHRNVVSYVNAFVDWARLSAADRVLQHGTLAFDICIEEIFPALSVGGQVVICVEPTAASIVSDAIRHHVTMVCTTPILMQYFNRHAQDLQALRLLASGGDSLHPEDIAALLARGIEVHNSFGPTETTVTATSHAVQLTDDPLPIGRPLSNARAYVLDAHLQPLPVGVPGELCIGGAGVARGYLNRPELSAERFVIGPDGERVYRSGDRGRWLASGQLEFLGRVDRQVKVRGFRVELGEIEAAIALHDEVEQVVVIAPSDRDSQKRLLAYVVPKAASATQLESRLRTHLRQHLPSYMLPGAYIILSQLPLTATGKLDRNALPAPHQNTELAPLHRPRSVIEQDLLALWREVLQYPSLDIFDNFFEFGGHSLLAIRLVSRIASVWATELPVQALFRYPCVAELAAYLGQHNPDLPWSTLVELQPTGQLPPLFCLPGDGGNVFYFYPLIHALGKQRPIFGLEALGVDGKQPPHETVEAAAAHHIREIRRRFPQGPYHFAGHSFGGLIAFEIAQRLRRDGDAVGMVAIVDTLPPAMPLPEASEAELLVIFEGLFAEEYGQPPALTVEALTNLNTEQRLLALKQALEAIGALPAGASLSQVRGLFGVFQTNFYTRYHPTDVIKHPIELLLAEACPSAERQQMIDGWCQLAEPRVRVIPGTHTTMTYPPHVNTLAAALTAALTEAEP